MNERTIHTDRKLKFESTRGTIDFTVNSDGFTIRMLEVADADTPECVIAAEFLSLAIAREIRDFLDYALAGEPISAITDTDGRGERRVAERRVIDRPAGEAS